MTVPLTDELCETPDVFGRLAGFLREVTGYAPADQIHARIMEHLAVPGHDPRIDGALEDPAVFEAVWTTLTAGIRLPHGAWQSVVLPLVVACSTERDLKVHLGLAASFWVAATAASDLLAAESVAAASPTELSEPTEPEPRDASVVPAGGRGAAKAAHGPRRRWALAGVVTVVLLIAAAAGLWWAHSRPSNRSSAWVVGAHRAELPVAATTPAAPPMISTLPAPSPTWAGPGSATAPGAPAGLYVVGVTKTTISVAWRAPIFTGSGGIAYYRIIVDGRDMGWTDHTAATIAGRTPATAYTIAIVAYSNGGRKSPSSVPVTARTAGVPTSQPTPAAPR